jgi:hypothetical protein
VLPLVVLAVTGFAACGGDSGGDTTTIITQTTTTETPSGDAASAVDEGSSSNSNSSGGAERVPDLVGERLDVAEDELDGLGIRYEEIGGGTFGIVVRSNWEVCETRPKSGARADSVKLIVARPGEC